MANGEILSAEFMKPEEIDRFFSEISERNLDNAFKFYEKNEFDRGRGNYEHKSEEALNELEEKFSYGKKIFVNRMISIYNDTQSTGTKMELTNYMLGCLHDDIIRDSILDVAVKFDKEYLMNCYERYSFPDNLAKNTRARETLAKIRKGIIIVLGKKLDYAQSNEEKEHLVEFVSKALSDEDADTRAEASKIIGGSASFCDVSKYIPALKSVADSGIYPAARDAVNALTRIKDASSAAPTLEGILSAISNLKEQVNSQISSLEEQVIKYKNSKK